MIRHFLLITILALGLTGGRISAVEASIMVGVVNFSTCITESKYGKNEQTQLENIKTQWSSLIEETEKELKSVAAKMEDTDGLSPEAEDELKVKYKALNEDMAKYQNQLYQVLNQANYFFIQKMASYISKASEQVAQEKNLQYVLNKEACFFNKPELEVTKLVIAKMDINYEKDVKSKKISENEAPKAPASKEIAKEVSKKETKDAVKEVAKEPAKEVSKKETKDAVKEVAKEPAKEVSKKETKDAIKEALKDIAKELSKKETKDISKETVKETTKDVKKELNQK
jgi:outer membrane protein